MRKTLTIIEKKNLRKSYKKSCTERQAYIAKALFIRNVFDYAKTHEDDYDFANICFDKAYDFVQIEDIASTEKWLSSEFENTIQLSDLGQPFIVTKTELSTHERQRCGDCIFKHETCHFTPCDGEDYYPRIVEPTE